MSWTRRGGPSGRRSRERGRSIRRQRPGSPRVDLLERAFLMPPMLPEGSLNLKFWPGVRSVIVPAGSGGVDGVIVAERHHQIVGVDVEVGWHPADRELQLELVGRWFPSELDLAFHAEPLRLVVDRRRPGPLLNRLVDDIRAALMVFGGHGRGITTGPWPTRAVPTRGEVVAESGAPATDRVLEHARVVEGALVGSNRGSSPDRAERRRRRLRSVSQVVAIDVGAVAGVARDVEDLLVRLAGRCRPSP